MLIPLFQDSVIRPYFHSLTASFWLGNFSRWYIWIVDLVFFSVISLSNFIGRSVCSALELYILFKCNGIWGALNNSRLSFFHIASLFAYCTRFVPIFMVHQACCLSQRYLGSLWNLHLTVFEGLTRSFWSHARLVLHASRFNFLGIQRRSVCEI